jgi:hypothetical protein
VIIHQRQEEWKHVQSRRFSILCDQQTGLIGSFGKSVQLSALETDHPSVIELLQNAFFHDVIMEQIEQDFSNELKAKYGEHYKGIKEQYAGILELG